MDRTTPRAPSIAPSATGGSIARSSTRTTYSISNTNRCRRDRGTIRPRRRAGKRVRRDERTGSPLGSTDDRPGRQVGAAAGEPRPVEEDACTRRAASTARRRTPERARGESVRGGRSNRGVDAERRTEVTASMVSSRRPPPPLLRPLRRHLRLRLRVGPGLPAFPPPCPRPRLALPPLPRLLQAGRTRLLQAERVSERFLGYARVPGYCTSITRMATESFTCARRIASAPRTLGRANLHRSMPRGQPPARTGTTCARHACAENSPK